MQIKSLTVAKIKKNMNLSDISTEKLCRILREAKVNVEKNTRKFLADIDQFLKPFYEEKTMEMEVNVTKRVIKTVRGRGGKLVKKPVEVRKIVKKDKHVAIVKDLAPVLKHVKEMHKFQNCKCLTIL